MGVVDEAVEDRVGLRPVADHLVPVFDGELARDEGGPVDVPVVHDLQEVPALFVTVSDRLTVVGTTTTGAKYGCSPGSVFFCE